MESGYELKEEKMVIYNWHWKQGMYHIFCSSYDVSSLQESSATGQPTPPSGGPNGLYPDMLTNQTPTPPTTAPPSTLPVLPPTSSESLPKDITPEHMMLLMHQYFGRCMFNMEKL